MSTENCTVSGGSESVEVRGHISWWFHVWDYVIACVCAMSATVLGWAGVFWVLTLPLWVFAGYRMAKSAIDVLTTQYVVTNDTVALKSGWLSTKKVELALDDVRGVSVERSLLNRLVGIGDVLIGNAAKSGIDLKIRDIRHPQAFADLVIKRKQA